MANEVRVLDPPRAIGWRPGYRNNDGDPEFGGWIWHYDLAPLGPPETEVTLTYDWSAGPGPGGPGSQGTSRGLRHSQWSLSWLISSGRRASGGVREPVRWPAAQAGRLAGAVKKSWLATSRLAPCRASTG